MGCVFQVARREKTIWFFFLLRKRLEEKEEKKEDRRFFPPYSLVLLRPHSLYIFLSWNILFACVCVQHSLFTFFSYRPCFSFHPMERKKKKIAGVPPTFLRPPI